MMRPSPYLNTAIVAAKKAGKFIRSKFGSKVEIYKKRGDFRNLVTTTDIRSQSIIEKELLSRFPQTQVLGEETEFGKRTSKLLWVIDPIDGTTNFTQKIPYFAIVIGLIKDEEIIAGVTYNPISEDLYIAESGKGAYHNGKRIHSSKTKTIDKAFGAIGWGKNYKHGSNLAYEFINRARKIRVNGSVALSMCEVASGHYDFFVSSGDIHLWDVVAGIITVKEAGGATTNIKGQKIGFSTNLKEIISANNNTLREDLIKFVKKKKV